MSSPSRRKDNYSQYDRIDRKINRMRHNEQRNRHHEEESFSLTNKNLYKNIKPKDINFLDD